MSKKQQRYGYEPIRKNYPLAEAAPLIGVTLNTLRQWVSNGVVESLLIGRKRVIPERVLERISLEGLDTRKRSGAA